MGPGTPKHIEVHVEICCSLVCHYQPHDVTLSTSGYDNIQSLWIPCNLRYWHYNGKWIDTNLQRHDYRNISYSRILPFEVLCCLEEFDGQFDNKIWSAKICPKKWMFANDHQLWLQGVKFLFRYLPNGSKERNSKVGFCIWLSGFCDGHLKENYKNVTKLQSYTHKNMYHSVRKSTVS